MLCFVRCAHPYDKISEVIHVFILLGLFRVQNLQGQWLYIVIIDYMSENVSTGAQVREVRALNKLQFIVLLSSESFLGIDIKNVLGLNTGFRKDSWVTHRVPGIPNGQGNSGPVLKVFPQKLVPFLYVQYHVLICGTDLIIHLPPAVNYLE